MRVSHALILVFFCFTLPDKAVIASDVLELTNHITIEGIILNPDETPRKTWQVEMMKGVIVELPHRTAVDRLVTRSQVIDQYYAKAPFLPETVETHLKIAEVCMSQGLEHLGNLHYQRVLDIDPENQTARKALNHRKVNGEWTTADAEMLRQGYIKNSRGIWTTRQNQMIFERQMQLRQIQVQSKPDRIVQNPGFPSTGQIRITDFDARRGSRD